MRRDVSLFANFMLVICGQLEASDGPINSSLPFFTKCTTVTPTPYSTCSSDAKTGTTTIAFTTRRGIRVLKQQWSPASNGKRSVRNRIYDSDGRLRILEEVQYSNAQNSVQITSYRLDRTMIAIRYCDGYGHPLRTFDDGWNEISATQYAALLRAALAN